MQVCPVCSLCERFIQQIGHDMKLHQLTAQVIIAAIFEGKRYQLLATCLQVRLRLRQLGYNDLLDVTIR